MKKVFTLFLLVFLGSSSALFAQSTIIIPGIQQVTEQKNGSYFIQEIPLKNNVIPEIKLTDIQSKNIIQPPHNNSFVGNSFLPDIFIETARRQKYATLQIPLYCRNGNGFEQLLSYNLSVKYPDTSLDSAGKFEQKPTGSEYAAHSVLATGTWYKMAVSARGIYKIDYSFLQSMGINPAQVNPNNIRIYGDGGTELSETVSDNQPDDLIQNAVYVHASGTTFGPDDYVLFYANGPVLWSKDSVDSRFIHTNNAYSDYSYYFLNFDLGSGLRISSENADGSANQTFTDFDAYKVYDRDSINIAATGRTWWSNPMNSQTGFPSSTNLTMNLGSVEDSVFAEVHVANVNTSSGNILTMKINGQTVQTVSLPGSNSATFYSDATQSFYFEPGTPNLNIQFNYDPAGDGSAYLDFIELNYKRPLLFSGNEMNFRNWESAALSAGQLAGYNISNAPAGLEVWDITNPLEPVALNGTQAGNTYHFTREGGSLHEFIAFQGTQFPNPQFVEDVANQDLHGLPETDMLIITNNDLKPAADELAYFHRQRDGISVTVATVDKIYNEFSSGGQDIGGIRNFIKMFYDRASSPQDMIQSVLLLGAASYDFKNRLSNNTNIVPTYETVVSGNEDNTFSTDDYFALLDQGEYVLGDNDLLDVGIGRIPATNLQEAENAVNKIETYVSPASFGPWKNIVSFVADDHDYGNIGTMNHLDDCEAISSFFYNNDREYNLYKIYADAYNSVPEAGGKRYPDVNKAIDDRIYNGTFLMSYSGHGDAVRWSHEAILTPDDYDNWSNIDKLPIMFTGTCDFGRFDDPNTQYAGVKLMMNPNGGSIAMITTTQAVYEYGNTQLGTNYMKVQFGERDNNGNYFTLGEALRRAKNDITGTGSYYNKVKYVLLGDPALRLPIPSLQVKTDSLMMMGGNGQWVQTDSLKALGEYSLIGSVTDAQGNLQSDFNGSAFVTIFDKPTTVHTVNTVPGVTPTFQVQNSVVAKVRAEVQNGHFSAEFIVPKDINYDLGLGKISYYAQSDTKDASGLDTTEVVGGYNQNAESDDQPPVVKTYIDDNKFRDGGVTGPNPLLYAELSDDHGINVSGGSVGHDLVAILDGNIQNPIILNDYYQTEEGDFRKGFIKFPMFNLPDGRHTITVKAWDTYNNSGEGSVSFVVKNEDTGFISTFYNYPNPVTDVTHFVFQHNEAGEPMTVTLQIYNTAGAIQWNYQKQMQPEGDRTEIIWDGTGTNGQPLAKGVYFCRLHIQTQSGAKATAYTKIVLLKP